MPNKVKYNLKNVHWAKLTLSSLGTPTFGTVHPIPGAVSLTLDAQGDVSKFYADGIVYYQGSSNNGYAGDLEIALLPEDFRTEILKEVKDNSGVLAEYASAEPEEFALLYEFDGDVKSRRHVMYRCKATRPSVSGKTTEESITPQTDSLHIEAVGLPSGDNLVKASTGDDTATNVYNNWFNSVYQPSGSGSSVKITGNDTVAKNSTTTLTATTTPAGGTVNWSTNNSSVATVTSGGVVAGVAVGKAVIMATLSTDGSVYDVKTITVTNS